MRDIAIRVRPALRIGRFRLRLPAALAVVSRVQRMYTISIRDDLPALPVVERNPTSDAVVRRALTVGEVASADTLRTHMIEGLGPAAWMPGTDRHGLSRRLVALRSEQDRSLRLALLASVGRESQSEILLRRVADGYRPTANKGFCLEQGAMVLEPGRNEQVMLHAEGVADSLLDADFETRTIERPRAEGVFGGPFIEDEALPLHAVTMANRSRRPRTVAGFDGIERSAEFRSAGQPSLLWYQFVFQGVPLSAVAPEIVVRLRGPLQQAMALESAWEGLLASIRRVPLA